MGRVFEGSDSVEAAWAANRSGRRNRISDIGCERIRYGTDVARRWRDFNRGRESVGKSAKELDFEMRRSESGAAADASHESGRGQPHSKTLSRRTARYTHEF